MIEFLIETMTVEQFAGYLGAAFCFGAAGGVALGYDVGSFFKETSQ